MLGDPLATLCLIDAQTTTSALSLKACPKGSQGAAPTRRGCRSRNDYLQLNINHPSDGAE